MSENEGRVLLVLLALLVMALAYAKACATGKDWGEHDARCEAHAEYAKTQADTAVIVRRFPDCAATYYSAPMEPRP